MAKKQTDQALFEFLTDIGARVEALHNDLQNILVNRETAGIKATIAKEISAGKLKKISSSLIMRRFKVGYSQAARLMDELEQDGFIVGDILDTVGNADIKEQIIKDSSTGKLKKISTSWIQRRFGIGYSRAALIMDELHRSGLIK